MKASSVCKEDAKQSLIGAIFWGILSFLCVVVVVVAPTLGIKKVESGWLLDVVIPLIPFCVSIWEFMEYFNDKKNQRKFEKEEVEAEKQKLVIANKQ